MNALDQAFIKAFAKDRPQTATAQRRSTELRAQPQPPAEGVESVSLVLHDLYEQGKRLRIDRPSADFAGLDAHMIVPMVEHVQSYDPVEVSAATQPLVVFDDRLNPLGEELSTSVKSREPDAEPDASITDTESDVELHKEAKKDKEVPTLDLPVHHAEAERRTADIKPQSEDDLFVDQCSPRTVVAASQLNAPELLTREWGTLDGTELPFDPADYEVGIFPPALDLDVLASAAGGELAHDDGDGDTQIAPTSTPTSNAPTIGLNVLGPSGLQFHDVPLPAPSARNTLSSDPDPEHAGSMESVLELADTDAIAEADAIAEENVPAFEAVAGSPTGDTELDGQPVIADEAIMVATVIESEADAVTEPASIKSFTPAWEVDTFRWPEVCNQLDQQTGGRLTQSGDELYVAARDGLKVLVVTSSNRQEGRSTLALCLARSSAIAGGRVALVDADASNPELAHRLGMESPCDWPEVVHRGEPLSEAAVASLEDRVTLFPRTSPAESDVDSFDESLVSVIGELRQHFDLVIVDLPPVKAGQAVVESSIVSCPVDMAVVVRNVQVTTQDQCLDTVAVLRTLGIQAVGVIENFTQPDDIA